VGAFALAGLTACGDKVNVTQAAPDSAVTAVTVSPPSANLNVGDKITLVATVTAGAAQTNRNVTWTTSNAAVATVDATSGLVTAVGGGTTSIIAASSANPSIKGASAITVGAVVQPTVEISTINQTVGSGSVPATLSNIAGQLDVTLNVDPGTQKLSKVNLIMNCGGADTVVATQSVASADVAPLSAEDAAAPITLSFNTAAFNAANGVVAFHNGACSLKASAVTTTGTIVASSGTPITLNNNNLVSATFATTPGTGQIASATDANGLLWRAGSVTVTAIPVIFSANTTIATASVSLMNSGADAALGKNGVTVNGNSAVGTLTGLTPTSGVITAAFPLSTSATGGVGGAVVDTLGVQVTTVDSNGNPGPTLTASSTNFIRLDNRAPDITTAPPSWIANAQNTTNNWVGANFTFTASGSTPSLNLGSASGDNQAAITAISPTSTGGGGVDKVTITTQSSPTGAGTFTTFSGVSALAETSNSTSLDLRLVVCDALGNCSNTLVLTQFGVDKTPPSLTQTGGPKNLSVFNAGTGAPGTASFVVGDTSNTVGVTPSGGSSSGVLVSVQELKPSGSASSATVCVVGTSTGTAPSQSCSKQAFQAQNAVTTLPAAPVAGEYTMVVNAVDQAGNTSAAQTIKYYVDLSAPALSGGVAVPASIANGTAFTSTAADSMDVAAGNGYIDYPTVGVRIFNAGTASPTGVTFDNVLTRSAAISITLANFYRSLTNTIGGAGVKADIAGIRAIDAAGNLSVAQQVALPATNIATATDTVTNTGGNGISAFATTSSLATVDSTHTVTTLTATATPINATSGSPFNQVCFFFASPTGAEGGAAGPSGAAAGELVPIGCTSAISVSGSGASRLFNYSISWTPSRSALATNSIAVFAVGGTAGGSGLITAPVAVQVNP